MRGSLIRLTVGACLALMMMAGCTAFDNTLRFLTASRNVQEADLQNLYGKGAEYDYVWASGVDGSITFDKSGSASISYGEKQDTGTWNVAGNMLCTTWKELGAGEEQCYSIYSRRRGARYRLFNADGSYHATAEPR